MNWQAFLIIVVKALIFVNFGMILGVMLTWADRRAGSMLQDRVGPTRAVIWIPKRIAQAGIVVPALVLSAAVLCLTFIGGVPEHLTRDGIFFSQGALFITWFTLLVIGARVRRVGVHSSFDRFFSAVGDPRRFFYVGVGIQVLLLALSFAATEGPSSSFFEALFGGGACLAALAMVFGSFYAAASIREERVGLRLAGLLHGGADGIKTLFKEDIIPPNADRLLHSLAPFVSFFPALVVLAVVPFGDALCFGTDADGGLNLGQWIALGPGDVCGVQGSAAVMAGTPVNLQMVSLNVGILYFFAMAGTGIIGAALAGWASDNKFSLMGGLRAASQMVSYEVTLGLTLIGMLMIYGQFRIENMVQWQANYAWGVFVQPFAFVLFFAAAIAETKRIPFDLPEGESEIVAGYFTEYSGMKFAMFFFSEYVAIVTSSALMVTVFFGGWDLPFVTRTGVHVMVGTETLLNIPLSYGAVVILGVIGFIGKIIALCMLQLFIRWTLPRFRYDQLMKLGWRILLPASLGNIVVTAIVMQFVLDGMAPSGAPPTAVNEVLADLSQLTEWVIGVAGGALFVWLVMFLLRPPHKKKLLITSAAKFANAMGGTPSARLGS